MPHRQRARLKATLVACALVVAGSSITRAQPLQRISTSRPLLDVPYLTQTGELCGGAALAMVLRYWGTRDVFAEDFTPLLDRSASGIPVEALVKAARDRGSPALQTRGEESTSALRTALDLGRPAIALIEDTPDAYHYVVVVARTETIVIFHDPARAPFRAMPVEQFDRLWSTTEHWMLVVLANTNGVGESASVPANTESRASTCDALVDQNVALAGAGQRAEADAGLTAALTLCPTEPAVWRELAGLRFVESKWSESSRLAHEAVRLDPNDTYAWTLIATSEFLQDHRAEALDSWNHIGQPQVDVVAVDGAERTRRPVIVQASGLRPRELLTADRFDRAARRLGELPVAASTDLKFQPDNEGKAAVQAVVVERDVRPRGLVPLAAIGGSALVRHEVFADFAGPTGSGELWSANWRWATGRPRVSFRLALPTPNLLRGVAIIDAWWEEESYRPASSLDGTPRIERRSVRASLSDWAPHQLRWRTGAALDRIDARDFIAVDGLLDKRLFNDRAAVGVSGTWWSSAGRSASGFGKSTVTTTWRSTRSTTPTWFAGLGLSVASPAAPRIVWPGAGTGPARDMLLRAHPLLDDGVIVGAAFGRRIAYASMEYRPTRTRTADGRVSAAAFIDAARTWNQTAGTSRAFLVDVGAGVRVQSPGIRGLRLDAAYGVRDRRRALSAGWQKVWPNP